jgi:hypothetical protein
MRPLCDDESMPERQVRELAEELGRRLGDEALDPESKAALTELHRRVERALAGEQAASADHARGLVARFEERHPDLTAFVQRLADALMNAGL